MSRLRQKAGEVKSEGARERRNWNPPAGSVHCKVYKWWLRKSGKVILRENFCHYWRVVFIWAPLRWLMLPFLGLVMLAVVVTGTVVGLHYVSVAVLIFAGILGLVYIAFGMRIGVHMLYELNNDEFSEAAWSWLKPKKYPFKVLLTFLVLPVILPLAAVLLICGLPIIFLVGLGAEYDVYRKFGSWTVEARFGDSKWITWLRPWLVVPAALLVLSYWYEFPRFILGFAGWVLVMGGLVIGASALVDGSRERAKRLLKEARQREAQAELDELMSQVFQIIHPEWFGNTYRYQAWLSRYERYMCSYWDYSELRDVPRQFHLRWISRKYEAAFGKEETEFVLDADRQAGWIVRTLTATGDFFVLLWSVVLTKKWKICPLVEIPRW